MICPKCAHENNEVNLFCEECGETLSVVPPEKIAKPSIIPVLFMALPTTIILICALIAAIYFFVLYPGFDNRYVNTMSTLDLEMNNYENYKYDKEEQMVIVTLNKDLFADKFFETAYLHKPSYIKHIQSTDSEYKSSVELGALDIPFDIKYSIDLLCASGTEGNGTLLFKYISINEKLGGTVLFNAIGNYLDISTFLKGDFEVAFRTKHTELHNAYFDGENYIIELKPDYDYFYKLLRYGQTHRKEFMHSPMNLTTEQYKEVFQKDVSEDVLSLISSINNASENELYEMTTKDFIKFVFGEEYTDDDYITFFSMFDDIFFAKITNEFDLFDVQKNYDINSDLILADELNILMSRANEYGIELYNMLANETRKDVLKLVLPELVLVRKYLTENPETVVMNNSVYNFANGEDFWKSIEEKLVQSVLESKNYSKFYGEEAIDIRIAYDNHKNMVYTTIPFDKYYAVKITENGDSQFADVINFAAKANIPEIGFPFPGDTDRREIVRAVIAFENTQVDYFVRYVAVSGNAAFTVLSPVNDCQTILPYYLEKTNKQWAVVKDKVFTIADYKALISSEVSQVFDMSLLPIPSVADLKVTVLTKEQIDYIAYELAKTGVTEKVMPIDFVSATDTAIYVKFGTPEGKCFILEKTSEYESFPELVLNEEGETAEISEENFVQMYNATEIIKYEELIAKVGTENKLIGLQTNYK